MNGKQAARAAAKRIEEMEHTIAQYKQDVKDYNAVIEDMISGKSPCSWCEDVGECILDANGNVGCTEWMLRFRKPGSQPEGGELDGEEGKAAGTDLNPVFGVEE
jgi:hypothetical protein